MTGQCGHHRFARQLEVKLVERTDNRHRPLDQRGDLVIERLAFHDAPAGALRRRLDALADHFPSAFEVCDDMAILFQHREVVVRFVDDDRGPRMEAMPARFAPGANAHDLAVNDVLAVQQDDPVNGTHELGLTRAPAHPARDRQRCQGALDHFRQEFRRAAALLGRVEDEPLALVRCGALEILDGDPALGRERRRRRRRVAAVVERDADGRSLLFHLAIALRHRKLLDQDREAAGACVHVRVAMLQAGIVDGRGKVLAEGLHQAPQRFGRHLLGADLDEQIAWPAHDEVSRTGSTTESTMGKPSASRLA